MQPLFYLKLFFDLERGDDGQVVTDASLIDGSLVGAVGFIAAVCGVAFEEERKGKNAGLLMRECGGVREDMVKSGPLALILVSAWLQLGCAVNEVMTAREEFELLGVGFSIKIAHDDEVGVLSLCAHRFRVRL